MKKPILRFSVLIIVIITLLFAPIGCSKSISVTELEKIHSGLLYNMDESILFMDYFMNVVDELSSEKYLGRVTGKEGNKLAVEYISQEFKEVGLLSPKEFENYTQSYPLYSGSKITMENVIGLIPGANEENDEVIIIGAHLDHLGGRKEQFYPGALDNASGVGAIIEIANFININKIKPQNTILFIAFNGEETGFTGSKYYVENPVFPLEKSVLINLDQVGSKEIIPTFIITKDSEGNQLKNDIYELSQELHMDSKKVTSTRSDHTPFEEKGIEAISIVHAFDRSQGYHTPNDTIDIVSKDRAKEVINLVLYYLDKNVY